MNITDPSNPVLAQWDGGQRVPEMENMITTLVEYRFLPQGLSDRWKGTHGMNPQPNARIKVEEAPKKKTAEDYLEDFFK